MPDKDLEASLLAHTDGLYPPTPPSHKSRQTSGGRFSSASPSGPLGKALIAILALLVAFSAGRSSRPAFQPFRPSSSPPPAPLDLTSLRDRPYDPLPPGLSEVRTLNYEQCDAAFPKLWDEVDNTVAAFKEKGISLADLAEMEKEATRVVVVDGQLYVKSYHGESTTRSLAILASLQIAILTSPDPFPDVDFVFRCTDNLDPGPRFGLTKARGEAMFLLPDFGFESWPEAQVHGWGEARRKALAVEAGYAWRKKDSKLFWRGAFLSKIREHLREIAEAHSWGDVGTIKWDEGAAGRVPIEDHCKKRYLASADSHSYSGRLKHLLLCRSVVVTHRKKWVQHFHGALDGREDSPTQNWVELKGEEGNEWEGLEGAMDRLIGDDEYAQRIAENAVRSMRDRYLTPASITCYWRRVLAEYATLQTFKPVRAGIDYQTFGLVREVNYHPQ